MIKTRISSDRADSNTISQIVWVSIAITIVIGIGGLLYKTIMTKGNQITNDINNADNKVIKNQPNRTQ